MITLNNLNERGIAYIAMAIQDIISSEGHDANKAEGLYLQRCWLSPETCYWLKKLLEEAGEIYSSQETRDLLQGASNDGL